MPNIRVPFNGSTERALKVRMAFTGIDFCGVPFNGSTERALKEHPCNRAQENRPCSIQRLNRESTERGWRRPGLAAARGVPFNGSTERALKVGDRPESRSAGASSIQRLNRESTERSRRKPCRPSIPLRSIQRLNRESTESWATGRPETQRSVVPFNGSTERALKVSYLNERTITIPAFHSTAQQREH